MRDAILALGILAGCGAAAAEDATPSPADAAREAVSPLLRRIETAPDTTALAAATAGFDKALAGPAAGAEGRDAARRAVRDTVLAARDRLAAALRRGVEADLRGNPGRYWTELTRRRESAVGHIMDEHAYPDGEGARKAQPRVDAKVAAVRELWETPLLAAGRMKPSVPADLEALNAAVAAALAGAGIERLAKDALRIEALLADPGGEYARVLRANAPGAFARKRLDQNRKGNAWNARIADLPPAVAEQIAITNAYREMLGRLVLQIDPALVRAAQGHAEVMAGAKRLFHRGGPDGTPASRIRKAGYEPLAIGENICGAVATAREAHAMWCRSPGHHRSLIDPLFNQIGVGHAEGYWVQNFGRGRLRRPGDGLGPPR